MSIRAKLSADRDRGPGHGILRIGGFSTTSEQVRFALMRNQGNEPHLGPSGRWQGGEAWHARMDFERDGEELVLRLGPELIDPIVGQATTVAYRITLAADDATGQGTLRVNRPLLGSAGIAPGNFSEASNSGLESPEPHAGSDGSPGQTPKTPIGGVEEDVPGGGVARGVAPKPSVLSRVLLGLAIASLPLITGVAWYRCLLPGFGPSHCGGGESERTEAKAPEAKEPVRSCTGLGPEECLAAGKAALGDREGERARQLLQQAARLGATEANTLVGRMYDPGIREAQTSPVYEPDWETAVYWYEISAAKGDPAALIGAGRLLCQNARTDFERKRGSGFLEKAAAAGDSEAKSLLTTCTPAGGAR